MDRLGLSEYVELKHGDLTKSIDEEDVDAVILDIPTPWLAVSNARKALRDGGAFISKLNGDLIIDTHAAIKTPYGYYPGMPSKVVETLKPDAIVVLEFRPEDILQRRMKDLQAAEGQRRIREVEAAEEVEEHQMIARELAAAAANHVCCYFLRLKFMHPQKYPYQHADEAAEALADLIKKLKGE